ncbi:MAG: hypothetical protein JSS60_09080 [Verrucomicrobia bacterium]|nr:hypothetical protein [Verrucomicrobiota bacterium]
MKIKKRLTLLVKVLAAAAVFAGLQQFCESQTKGFRPYLIVSNLPNDPRWDVPPLAEEEKKRIDALLDQPFTFLGSGGWCIAFLGEDKKTVLKFYRHSHLRPSTILREFSFEKLLMKCAPWPQGAPYFQEFNFKSCALLYKEAKERTGLLYVHLNKTEGMHKPVTLIDNIGVRHTIDLDKTEFLVQKKAELLMPHIHRLAKEKKIEEAKRCLDDMIECLLAIYKKGARDYDHSLRNNFGYTEDGAVTLDLSSFGPDESLMKPGEYRKEIVVKTRRLSRYLDKNHHDLYIYFEGRLSELMEKG